VESLGILGSEEIDVMAKVVMFTTMLRVKELRVPEA